MEYYGPRYKLEVLSNNMDNYNTTQYLESIKRRIIENLRSMPFAPSAPMREVPNQSVGKHLGIHSQNAQDSMDEDVDFQLDGKIRDLVRQRMREAGDALSDDEEIDWDDKDALVDAGINPFQRNSSSSGIKGGKRFYRLKPESSKISIGSPSLATATRVNGISSTTTKRKRRAA